MLEACKGKAACLMLMKFFRDFDIFMLLMFRCPACPSQQPLQAHALLPLKGATLHHAQPHLPVTDLNITLHAWLWTRQADLDRQTGAPTTSSGI